MPARSASDRAGHRPDRPDGAVDLYWIPLGAGTNLVRWSGAVYEACAAAVAHRPRCALYHSALVVTVPEGIFTVEQTPVPRGDPGTRGVVAVGPVGTARAGRLRPFRYEIRCWCDGTIPDLGRAVGSPVRLTDDPGLARRVLAVVADVPTPVWGRDELHTGEMWNSNSVVAWTLARSGVGIGGVGPPVGGRAPGWQAGAVVAGADGPHPVGPAPRDQPTSSRTACPQL